MSEVQQMQELVDGSSLDKPTNINLLGPFRYIVKLTGLDCSAIAAAQNGSGSKIVGHVSRALAIAVIVTMFYRTMTLFGVEGNVLSLPWAESNLFAFMGIHSIVCAFCLFGWTKNGFVPTHLNNLQQLKALRIEKNDELDEYTKHHKSAFFFTIPWLLVMMVTSIYNAFHKKYLFGAQETSIIMYTIFPVLAFMVYLITSTCIIYYVLIQISLNREVEYFNKELEKASEEKRLKDLKILTEFSYRQLEILKIVKQSNERLGSYAKFAPLFGFFSVINAIYLTTFSDVFPVVYFIMIIFSIFSIIGVILFALLPAAKVQDALLHTSKILMSSDEFESSDNQKVYQTYRIMCDRSTSMDARIYVVNAFPITTTNVNIAMFVVPNLGPLLMMLKKIMVANGLTV